MFTRLIAPALALGVALPVAAMDLKALTDEERALFRAEVRSYLMENPQVIMDAVDKLQAQQANAEAQADQTQATVAALLWVLIRLVLD